jgi:hypothetical protein
MATAADPAHTRQPIPIVDTEAERIFAILDAGKKLGAYHHTTLFAKHFEDGTAEYALRLWASANGLSLKDATSVYEDGSTIRTMCVDFDPNNLMAGCASLQWDRVAAPVEVREPAPGVVITPPVETWRPSDAPADDASIRFSLLEVD